MGDVAPGTVKGGDRTVIVIDDDDALLNALIFGFEIEGYRVLPFASAEAVLNLCEIPNAECMVIDHRLPRLDGLSLIEAMRGRGVSAPAILMTSHPGAGLRARCNGLQVPIVEKPLLHDELSRAIRSAVEM